MLDRIGIPQAEVSLTRDRTGRAAGYWGIGTPERNWVRLGQLVLQQGVWNGVQLLDPGWMAEVPAGTAVNGGYSMFFWTNRGDTHTIDTHLYRMHYDGPLAPYAPRDAYAFMGIGGQVVWVVPSLDLVVTRHGPFSDFDAVVNRLLHGVLSAIRTPARVASVAKPWQSALEGGREEGGLENGALGHLLLDTATLLTGPQLLGAPLPPAGPVRARALQVVDRRAPLAAGGTVTLPVRCPPRARLPCKGPVALGPAGSEATGAATTVELAAGTSSKVALAVPAALARAADRAGEDGAAAVVRATTQDEAAGVPTAIPVRITPSPGRLVVTVRPKRIRVGRTTRVLLTTRSRRENGTSAIRATVTVAGRRVRTDARGRVRVSLRPKRARTYRLTVRAVGHAAVRAKVVAR